LFLVLFLTLALTGCGGGDEAEVVVTDTGATSTGTDDDTGSQDTGSQDTGESTDDDTGTSTDTTGTDDTTSTPGTDDTTDTPDTGDTTDTGDTSDDVGETGTGDDTGDDTDTTGDDAAEPPDCEEDADCKDDSDVGWCATTQNGSKCTVPCDEGQQCPDDWVCGLVAGAFQCVPLHPTLCNPCTDKSQCAGFIGGADCVSMGDAGNFCASGCDSGCPDGYVCENKPHLDGTSGDHCVPADSGACTCSPDAIQKGLSTACANTNDSGACKGTRYCAGDGLTECTAAVAAPEICGGGDENCDGVTDEAGAAGCKTYYVDADADDSGKPGSGACLCSPTGDATALSSGDCDDDNAAVNPAEAEKCNGFDDNCDDIVDPVDTFGCTVYYKDLDEDGFGALGDGMCLCESTALYSTAKPGDCDDLDKTVFPEAPCGVPACNIFMLSGLCDPDNCGAVLPEGPCPNGLTCLNGSECRTECSDSAHCQPGLVCVGGACVAGKADGEACDADAACVSGHCANGFCCKGFGGCCSGPDADCNDGNPCTADTCGVSFQCLFSNLEGECAAAKCTDAASWAPASQCEDGVCVAGASQSCAGDDPCTVYSCAAATGCGSAPAAQGTPCGADACIGWELVPPKVCSATSECQPTSDTVVCPNSFACDAAGVACLTSCTEHSDCQPDSYCNGGTCDEKLEAPSQCSEHEMCAGGKCLEGFCCDGCCDYGTLSSNEYARAMEICEPQEYEFQGKNSCARVIADFGNFSHADKAPELGDTAMLQLSTGVASKTSNQQSGENQQTSGPDPDGTVSKANDLCGITMTLKAPPGAKGFAFDFIFFSAEYPEWVGTQFNDTFNAMMDSEVFDNENIAFDKNGKPISINVAFFTICNGQGCTEPGSKLEGTGYGKFVKKQGGIDVLVGGATGWLTTTVPVVPNETFTLRLVIYDEGDHIYDSDVLLNNFRWVEFVSGTGPVTEK